MKKFVVIFAFLYSILSLASFGYGARLMLDSMGEKGWMVLGIILHFIAYTVFMSVVLVYMTKTIKKEKAERERLERAKYIARRSANRRYASSSPSSSSKGSSDPSKSDPTKVIRKCG